MAHTLLPTIIVSPKVAISKPANSRSHLLNGTPQPPVNEQIVDQSPNR